MAVRKADSMDHYSVALKGKKMVVWKVGLKGMMKAGDLEYQMAGLKEY